MCFYNCELECVVNAEWAQTQSAAPVWRRWTRQAERRGRRPCRRERARPRARRRRRIRRRRRRWRWRWPGWGRAGASAASGGVVVRQDRPREEVEPLVERSCHAIELVARGLACGAAPLFERWRGGGTGVGGRPRSLRGPIPIGRQSGFLFFAGHADGDRRGFRTGSPEGAAKESSLFFL